MCKSKMAIDAAQPSPTTRTSRSQPTQSPRNQGPQRPTFASSSSSVEPPSTSNTSSAQYTSTSNYKLSSDTSSSSRTSLSSLRESLPETPHIYDFNEICSATNNFLAKRFASASSSTPSWRCTLRGKDVIVFQRKFRRKTETSELRALLSLICRSHHSSIVKILGASVSGDHIYLVYEFIYGANLADCLRNQRNPNFTVLSTWMSRMQIAADLAHGLDYIHNKTGLSINLVHNHIKSSSVVVTEPLFNAKICHFGAAQLCGESIGSEERKPFSTGKGKIGEISEESDESDLKESKLKRSDSRKMQFEGVRGYMSPEYQRTGEATQKSDVYAFGVVILELLSGEEPFRFKFDKTKRDFIRMSVIESAKSAIFGDGDGGGGGGPVEGRFRYWVDRRLKDSYPVEVAQKLTRVALECVHVDPDQRPNMGRVAGKISKLYLSSKTWSDNVKVPTEISVSLAPR
ncbi:lysM domain receptor-like kinase 3 [Ziziphus jujuba]|uniref:LysM domain receptor-like kinase 3 n=2 Tax=Ziziphus jujuba TaxID=326968 RepID=A0A6P3YSR5_ZIZJJ|nr:lysM domain receptor-like kinase 3 [Ziziphus jujuba]KAH7542664.1 hypothetical protein FEM48_Zijuj02G0098100 [Ziziphus jujuba var. spinosa]